LQTLPTKEHISNFSETPDIETASDDYARRFSGNIGQYLLNVQSDITLALLKPHKLVTILEVGGGHAQLAPQLIDAGYKVTVTGSSNICRKRLDTVLPHDSFDYVTCDLLNLPYEDNHFDAVLAFRLLPHLENWQKLVSEMARVSNRIVIFDYPDIRSFNFLYSSLFRVKKAFEKNTRSFRLFSRKEVLQVLKNQDYGKFILKPQFFMPMVFYRLINSVLISKTLEHFFLSLGLTYLFGSPIILKACKL
jgi:2-polyprenyl-3-methyl-5-hydroxy-6-metoxy-1,4-benzoquinol methylase